MFSLILSGLVMVVFVGGLVAAQVLWQRHRRLAWALLTLGLATVIFQAVLVTMELNHLATHPN
jgi:hypothetical protein